MHAITPSELTPFFLNLYFKYKNITFYNIINELGYISVGVISLGVFEFS